MEKSDQKRELVDSAFCEKCGFKGTPLCTHPDGYYQDEPAGLNKMLDNKCPRCSGDNIDSETEEPLKLCSDCGLIFYSDGTFISESDRD